MDILKKSYKEIRPGLTEYLPWAFFGGPGIVIQKDGYLQRTYRYKGPDLDCVDVSMAEQHTAEVGRAIMRLGNGWALFFEAVRSQIREYPAAASGMEGLARDVELERERYFTAPNTNYESEFYLTFLYAPQGDLGKKASGFIGISITADAEVREFDKRTSDIANILTSLAAVKPLDDAETMAYLNSTISEKWQRFAAPSGFVHLDHALADSPIEIYADSLKIGNKMAMAISIADYPAETFAGILNELNTCNIEMRYASRFICLDKEEAKKRLEAYGKKYFSGRTSFRKFMTDSLSNSSTGRIDVGAMALEDQVNTALVNLARDDIGFGYATNTIIVTGTDYAGLAEKVSTVKQIVQSVGFAAKIETVGCFQAWLGTLPGHPYANIRRPLLSTANLSHIVPLTSIWTGRKTNEFLKQISGVGAPNIVTATDAKTPFFLNLNPEGSDVGHTFIAGPTGAGKSTLLGALAIQWFKYPDSRIIIIDKDRSAENLTHSVKGTYYEPGSGTEVFQPFRYMENEEDRIWASEFIEIILLLQNLIISPEIRASVHRAMEELARIKDPLQRTVTTFVQLLQHSSKEIDNALSPYMLGGTYGSIFDADASALDFTESRWTMLELAPLMDMGQAVLVPALMHLFKEMDRFAFDGSPTLLVLDEAWLFLSHEYFQKTMKNWLKTLRKRRVFVVFATQEVADAAQSAIANTIIQQTSTKIFLPDPQAETPVLKAMYRSIGLSDAQIQALAKGTKKRDYLYISSDGTRMFQLALGDIALKAITSLQHKEGFFKKH